MGMRGATGGKLIYDDEVGGGEECPVFGAPKDMDSGRGATADGWRYLATTDM